MRIAKPKIKITHMFIHTFGSFCYSLHNYLFGCRNEVETHTNEAY